MPPDAFHSKHRVFVSSGVRGVLKKPLAAGALVLLACLLWGAVASAQTTLVNTYLNGTQHESTNGFIVEWNQSIEYSQFLAVPFSTAGQAWVLDAITLPLRSNFGVSNLDIYIAADSAGQPGTRLETLAINPTLTGAYVNRTFSSTGLALPANNSFWIVLTASTFNELNSLNDGSISWARSDPGVLNGISGFQEFDFDTSSPGPWLVASDDQLAYIVTVVPEPSAFGLIGGGLVLLVAVRKLRERAAV